MYAVSFQVKRSRLLFDRGDAGASGAAEGALSGAAARPDFCEPRGSVWETFIIFPLRSFAGRREQARQRQVTIPGIPNALRDVLR